MGPRIPPLIALEEHFLSAEVLNGNDDAMQEQIKAIPGVKEKLGDLGDLRLREMEKGKISMQIISHTAMAGSPDLAICQNANDQLAAAVSKNQRNFAGFAVLPVRSPEDSARELERCVKEFGFVGALVDNHANGTYYDGHEYDVMWQKAQELDVPVYLHPTWPTENMAPQYTGNFSGGASRSLGASGWGWHTDTGLHVLRLHAAGVFDRHPKLKLIIGHFGEMIPFQLDRVCALSPRWGDRKRKLRQVWDENIWITTSGVWSLDPLRCILGNTKKDRILFSVDFPFEKNENGLKWVQDLEQSGLVTKDELDMICYKNAERLLRIKAPLSET